MQERIPLLERTFTASIIDDRRRAGIRIWLRGVMGDFGVFVDDPAKTKDLLDLVDIYLKYACPRDNDEESLRISALYGMIIMLHGTGILTGEHLELTPEAWVRHVCTGRVEGDDPPESATLLAELGRQLRARRTGDEATSLFLHYAGRTYRAYRDKREDLLRGIRPASLAEYEANRTFRIGVYPWVWLWIALQGLVPPARLLGDPRLRRMLELTNQVTYLRNDVATIRRDLHDGIENYLLYLEEDLGCDRARAIEIVQERGNDKVRELLMLERAVVESPDAPAASELAGYFGFLESLMVGNLLAFDVFESMSYVEMDTLEK